MVHAQALHGNPRAVFAPLPPGYVPRDASTSVLHIVARDHVETFLAQMRARTEHGFGVPRFVEAELRGLLTCGIFAHGFARLRCKECSHALFVAFSCKGRAACPSCTGRRAAACAAHVVDDVLPHVPVRQWVLTFPRQVRWLLAKDAALCTKVIAVFLRALEAFQHKRAKGLGVSSTKAGFVTFLQRFSTALQLNVHLHTVTPDGVFSVDNDDAPATFHKLPPPRQEEVQDLLEKLVRRVARCIERHAAERDVDVNPDDALDASAARSAMARGRVDGVEVKSKGRFEAFAEGFSLHCGVHLHENDREGIERLCRYGARGPLAANRLIFDDDGRVRYRMKRRVYGKDELVMTGVELLEKLAVLVPPPRVNLTRFHGVFAPNAKSRAQVVPAKPSKPVPKVTPDETSKRETSDVDRRLDWASLLKRVFKIDILACGKCGGRMRLLALIDDAKVAAKILAHVGLPASPVEAAPARAPPQLALDFEAA